MKRLTSHGSAGTSSFRPASASRGRAGFTLIEMLVAFAVGSLLLVALTSIVSQSMAVSRKTNSLLLSNNAASAAVDLVSTDLESLSVTGKPYEYLRVTKEDVDGVTDVARVLMLTASGSDAASADDYGQSRAISYRLINQDPINPGGSRNIYGLYRSVVSAEDTFSDFAGQTNLETPFDALPPSLDDFVVGNVIDFQVRVFADGNQSPANVAGLQSQPVRISGNSTQINGTSYTGAPLTWAEVTLTVLEDRDNAVERLESGSLTLEDARTQYGFRLSRRVAIRTPL